MPEPSNVQVKFMVEVSSPLYGSDKLSKTIVIGEQELANPENSTRG